ncbi:hypothetical protein, partial [Pantoea ananatis]|uniref:hypothetical protein n=1 Tax=Pantoea ananas TaxID=553 RepID=UPI0019D366F5
QYPTLSDIVDSSLNDSGAILHIHLAILRLTTQKVFSFLSPDRSESYQVCQCKTLLIVAKL